ANRNDKRPSVPSSQQSRFAQRSVLPLAPQDHSQFGWRFHDLLASSSNLSQEIEARLASLAGRCTQITLRVCRLSKPISLFGVTKIGCKPKIRRASMIRAAADGE